MQVGQQSLQDEMLRAFVDKTFAEFDKDNSGTLDPDEMTLFFNKLFERLGTPKSITK